MCIKDQKDGEGKHQKDGEERRLVHSAGWARKHQAHDPYKAFGDSMALTCDNMPSPCARCAPCLLPGLTPLFARALCWMALCTYRGWLYAMRTRAGCMRARCALCFCSLHYALMSAKSSDLPTTSSSVLLSALCAVKLRFCLRMRAEREIILCIERELILCHFCLALPIAQRKHL